MKKNVILGALLLASASASFTSYAAPGNNFLNGKPFEYLNNQTQLNADDIAALQAVTDQLAFDIEQNNLAITELEANVATNTAAIADVQDQLVVFEEHLSATQDDVTVLFANLEALEAQHSADIDHLVTVIAEQRDEIARLRDQVQTAIVQLGQQIGDVQLAVDANSADIDSALAASAANTADILAMNAILDDHESRLVAAQSSLNVLVGNIATIQNQLSNLEFVVSGVRTDVDDLQALHTSTFTGVRQNVPQSSLNGWTECFSEAFGHYGTPISTVTSACNKAKLMVACRQTGSPTLKVAAYANRADVLHDVGTGRTATHAANGVNWYYSGQWSWGFAPGGQSVSRNSCDTNNTGSNDRICNHTGGNNLNGGWRCGNATGLNRNNSYERVFLMAD